MTWQIRTTKIKDEVFNTLLATYIYMIKIKDEMCNTLLANYTSKPFNWAIFALQQLCLFYIIALIKNYSSNCEQ